MPVLLEDVGGAVGTGEWMICTTNVPPVEGCRATSPRLVEKVERSSWAYCAECVI